MEREEGERRWGKREGRKERKRKGGTVSKGGRREEGRWKMRCGRRKNKERERENGEVRRRKKRRRWKRTRRKNKERNKNRDKTKEKEIYIERKR